MADGKEKVKEENSKSWASIAEAASPSPSRGDKDEVSGRDGRNDTSSTTGGNEDTKSPVKNNKRTGGTNSRGRKWKPRKGSSDIIQQISALAAQNRGQEDAFKELKKDRDELAKALAALAPAAEKLAAAESERGKREKAEMDLQQAELEENLRNFEFSFRMWGRISAIYVKIFMWLLIFTHVSYVLILGIMSQYEEPEMADWLSLIPLFCSTVISALTLGRIAPLEFPRRQEVKIMTSRWRRWALCEFVLGLAKLGMAYYMSWLAVYHSMVVLFCAVYWMYVWMISRVLPIRRLVDSIIRHNGDYAPFPHKCFHRYSVESVDCKSVLIDERPDNLATTDNKLKIRPYIARVLYEYDKRFGRPIYQHLDVSMEMFVQLANGKILHPEVDAQILARKIERSINALHTVEVSRYSVLTKHSVHCDTELFLYGYALFYAQSRRDLPFHRESGCQIPA